MKCELTMPTGLTIIEDEPLVFWNGNDIQMQLHLAKLLTYSFSETINKQFNHFHEILNSDGLVVYS